MLIDQITGVTEKLAITINSPLQGLIVECNKPMALETIEIQLVDFKRGTQLDIIREEKIETLGEFNAMGGGVSTSYKMRIEVADKGSLYLSGDRVLRVNLKNLTGANTYKLMTLKNEFTTEEPAQYEQMVIGTGLIKQEFPISDGELLILPKTNLADIRTVYNDGTEVILTADELLHKHMEANEYGYFIHTNGAETVTTPQVGAMNIFVIDLNSETSKGFKRISKIEINLSANPASYKFYKVVNLDKPGFDYSL